LYIYIHIIGEDGVSREPYEEVTVDVDPELQGLVIDSMSNRNGNLAEMKVSIFYALVYLHYFVSFKFFVSFLCRKSVIVLD